MSTFTVHTIVCDAPGAGHAPDCPQEIALESTAGQALQIALASGWRSTRRYAGCRRDYSPMCWARHQP